MIRTVKKKQIYRDAWLKFFQDEIKFDDGSNGTYGVVDRKNGVGIVVLSADNHILLNKEHRYPVNEFSWEIPGGGIDDGEEPEFAARRELLEETGIEAGKIESLGSFYPLSSLSTEKVLVFITWVKDESVNSTHMEIGESIEDHRWLAIEEALDMIDVGEISDALTANVVQIVARKYNKFPDVI